MSRKSVEELDSRVDLFRQKLKDSDDLKVKDDVFDTRTLMNLYALAKKGVIDALGGAVSTGKEANIFEAVGSEGRLAVKIYRIATSDFKSMQEYIIGDPRFGSVKGTKRAIITAWTKKEFRNLKRAEEAGVRVPHPIAIRENILIMELILDGESPAPLLKDVELEPEEASRIFEEISDFIALLYKKAKIVHADLSEFNILYNGAPIIIDMGQAVTLEHPNAERFLMRDVFNLARYFKKRYGLGSEDDIWDKIKR